MKKILLLLLSISLLFCGCHGQQSEIENVEFIRVVGIDYKDGQILLSLGTQLPQLSSGGKTSGGFTEDTLQVTCQSLDEGFNIVNTQASSEIFLGQISVLLIGQEAAEHGILDYLNYFVRLGEFRFDLPLLIVKGTTAHDAIEKGSSQGIYVADQIENLLSESHKCSFSGTVELSRTVRVMETSYETLYLPYLELQKEKVNEKDITRLSLKGYCLFQEDKLFRFLDEEQSRALNILNGTFYRSTSVLEENGGMITLDLTDGNSYIKPGKDLIRVCICLKAEIGEMNANVKGYEDEDLKNLTKKQEEEMKKQLEDLVHMLQENQLDCIAFGQTIYSWHPSWAAPYKGNWGERFSQLDFTIDVKVKITRTRTVNKPIQVWEK